MATLSVITFAKEPNALDIDAHANSVAASSGGDDFLNVGRTGFWVKSAAGAPRTVTFDAKVASNQGFVNDAAVVVPDGFEGFIAHSFDAGRFSDPADNMIDVTYDNEAGLTVAAVKFAD